MSKGFNMKVLYWVVIIGWYFLITILATTDWKGLGWWFLIICAIVLFFGDGLIRRLFKK
ncbi:hypothetical protein J7E52_12860 [Bacillus sp. ISL-34]|uniref:hypothetical protein n=1 Tax=Bacillus sp. ISL-34 TaxID=2819121 RepID=UPI001BE91CC5|nr:hypothetical protein [Bacillus sp. ISL-34]MBT2647609.1 hypothetical protein [Bacillus sp. ISL-34]